MSQRFMDGVCDQPTCRCGDNAARRYACAHYTFAFGDHPLSRWAGAVSWVTESGRGTQTAVSAEVVEAPNEEWARVVAIQAARRRTPVGREYMAAVAPIPEVQP